MTRERQIAKRRAESGAALLIAIFALLLISVVAIALVVTSGTDAALGGNYRTSTGAYYAGAAGLEEARGRLLWKNPNYINLTNSFPTLMSPNGLPTWGLTQVLYIVNPAGGETVDPTSANPANYPDTEYGTEFTWGLGGANVQTIASVSPVAGLPGPAYKWVRITAATEKSLNRDVNGDGTLDPATILYYNPAHVNVSNATLPLPSLVSSAESPQPPNTFPPQPFSGAQALEITALSVLPNGGRRMLQYVVAPIVISPSVTGTDFPAALTLLGPTSASTYQFSGTPAYKIDGRDACSSTTPQASVEAIGYTDPGFYAAILPHLSPTANYPGYPLVPTGPPPPTYQPTMPSISNTPSVLQQAWQNPASLDAVMQNITNSADVVLTGPATGANISSRAPTMSASNPMTIVVNGDLNLTGLPNPGGFGLLLVTGRLTSDSLVTWNGLVLVIGQGNFVFNAGVTGSGGIQGAVVVAKTRDNSGNLLTSTTLGTASFTSNGTGTNLGIQYNSCLAKTAQGPLAYKVLSFHEIALTN